MLRTYWLCLARCQRREDRVWRRGQQIVAERAVAIRLASGEGFNPVGCALLGRTDRRADHRAQLSVAARVDLGHGVIDAWVVREHCQDGLESPVRIGWSVFREEERGSQGFKRPA